MKLKYLFSAVICLVVVSVAVPVPVPGGQKSSADRVPSPGRTGVHYDPHRNVVTAYYSNDMPGHMRHVQQNHAQYPGNARPMDLATPYEHRRNRQQALAGIPSGLKDPALAVAGLLSKGRKI